MKFKNRLIIKPGTWNNFYYSKEVLKGMKVKEPVIITDSFENGIQNIMGLANNFRFKGNKWTADIDILKDIPEKILSLLEVAPTIKGKSDNGEMKNPLELVELALVLKSAIVGNKLMGEKK